VVVWSLRYNSVKVTKPKSRKSASQESSASVHSVFLEGACVSNPTRSTGFCAICHLALVSRFICQSTASCQNFTSSFLSRRDSAHSRFAIEENRKFSESDTGLLSNLLKFG